MNLNWIEADRSFSEPEERESWFQEYPEEEMILPWHFETLPQLRELLRERLGEQLSEEEILEAARTAFRCKPGQAAVPEAKDRQIADFIYQM